MRKHWGHNPLIGNHWIQSPENGSQNQKIESYLEPKPRGPENRVSRLSGNEECGGPPVVAGHLAGTGHHMECLAPDGITASLLTASVERGSQTAGAGRAVVSAVDQVAGVRRAIGGA